VTPDRRRRAVVAAVLGLGGVAAGGPGRAYLDRFAPLSGSFWSGLTHSVEGEVPNPYGDAEVTDGEYGVPHVSADDERAAYYAVGYTQAADRLSQMDLQRRQMRGRLAEIAGEAALPEDRFHRSMDFVAAAEATWDLVGESEAGPLVEAYAEGVNARLDREELPAEFGLLGYEPDPWHPVDTMLMEKQIAWGLTGSFATLRRAVVLEEFGEDVLEELFPLEMDHDSPILRGEEDGECLSVRPDHPPTPVREPIDPELVTWLSRFESDPGIGSNSWVVSGEHTTDGAPIVANDPHLLLMTPPLWYEQHVRTDSVDVRGFTFPGVPFVVIGENHAGAWGVTNVGADVIDFYRYETRSDDEYRYDGEWREFETREEVVAVDGAENETIEVKKAIHGPVIEREGREVGVAWTGLSATRTTEAIYEYSHADGLEKFLGATRKFDVPTQNLTYADRDGRTLYYATGRLPIREVDGEVVTGTRVFDGSAGEGEWGGFTPYGESTWEGFVPFEEKPHLLDFSHVATANQRVTDDLEHYVGFGFATPYRGERIYEVLDERVESGTVDRAFTRGLQTDTLDLRYRAFVPDLVEAVEDDHPETAALLASWDGRMERDSEAALVFDRWLSQYREEAFAERFSEASLDDAYWPNDWVLSRLDPGSEWFDGDRESTMGRALAAALSEIEGEGWGSYGDVARTGVIAHPFGLGFLDYSDWPTDGSSDTVKNFRPASAVGASVRLIVSPGGDQAEAVLPGGNSGSPASEHYEDQLRLWADGEYREMARETEGEVRLRFEGTR
jgi:penicillin G amidase